jgi:hypothetical protein
VSISGQIGGVTLRVSSERGLIGTISITGGALTGSNNIAQAIADSALRRAGGDPERALAELDGWSNGYVWAHT